MLYQAKDSFSSTGISSLSLRCMLLSNVMHADGMSSLSLRCMFFSNVVHAGGISSLSLSSGFLAMLCMQVKQEPVAAVKTEAGRVFALLQAGKHNFSTGLPKEPSYHLHSLSMQCMFFSNGMHADQARAWASGEGRSSACGCSSHTAASWGPWRPQEV